MLWIHLKSMLILCPCVEYPVNINYVQLTDSVVRVFCVISESEHLKRPSLALPKCEACD